MKIFSGKGQTWLGLVGLLLAIWAPMLVAEPIPTDKASWIARISGTIFAAITAVGRALGAKEEDPK